MSHSQIFQFSDSYPSYIYEDTTLDSFPFAPSDVAQAFISDASYNLQTPTSTSTRNLPATGTPFYPPLYRTSWTRQTEGISPLDRDDE